MENQANDGARIICFKFPQIFARENMKSLHAYNSRGCIKLLVTQKVKAIKKAISLGGYRSEYFHCTHTHKCEALI